MLSSWESLFLKARMARLFPRLWLVGLSVGLTDGTGLQYFQGLGYIHRAQKLRAGPDTLYLAGTASACVTAALFAILAGEGKLSLNDTIRSHLPQFAMADGKSGETVTILDFLTHRSGIYGHDPLWMNRKPEKDSLLTFFGSVPPAGAVGAKARYSALGYALLELVLEQASGLSYRELAARRLFQPLGMRSTYFGVLPELGAAKGYVTTPHGTAPVAVPACREMGTAGTMVSTPSDMARLLRFFIRGGEADGVRLVPEDSLRELYKPRQSIPWRSGVHSQAEAWAAAGWRADTLRGQTLLNCSGGTEGFYTSLSFDPERKIGLVLMCNSTGAGRLSPLNFILYDYLLGHEKTDWFGLFRTYTRKTRPSPAKRVKTNAPLPAAPREYVGRYGHPCGSRLEVVWSGSGFAVILGGVEHPFAHEGGNRFTLTGATLRRYGLKYPASFTLDKEGGVASLALALDEENPEPVVFTKMADAWEL